MGSVAGTPEPRAFAASLSQAEAASEPTSGVGSESEVTPRVWLARSTGLEPVTSGVTGRAKGFFRRSVTESSPTWTRTTDMVINSHPLYQLSYRGMRRACLRDAGRICQYRRGLRGAFAPADSRFTPLRRR